MGLMGGSDFQTLYGREGLFLFLEYLYTVCNRLLLNRRVWHFNEDHIGSGSVPS